MLDSASMSDQDDRGGQREQSAKPISLATLRLGKKPRQRRTGWKAEALLFDDLTLLEPATTPRLTTEKVPGPISREVAPPSPLPPRQELAAEPIVYTVRALVVGIRNQVEAAFTDVRVTGEISNLRPAPSGHLYFTLKDGEAQLPVILFRRQALLLRFRPKDGDDIEVRGRMSLYESRGQLQLIAESIELRGAGALQLAFERLKGRLLAEGLFDAARKRPMPAFPRCIGVISSPAGAVIRDIVTVAQRRHARLNLLLYPATMQGPTSPGTLAEGIRWFNAHPERVDLVLIARGGGSFEDLAGFNDETLARAIAASNLPVLSAIGHETDFTIADFVADLRAATPSAAAELITAAQHQIEARLDALGRRTARAIRFQVLESRQRYARLSAPQVLTRLRDAVSRRDQRIDDLRGRVAAALHHGIHTRHARLAVLQSRLRAQDVRLRLAATHRRLVTATVCLQRMAVKLIEARRNRLIHAQTRLDALSPLAVLNRGYALVYNAQGILLRTSTEVQPSETIHARLAHGTLTAQVLEIQEP